MKDPRWVNDSVVAAGFSFRPSLPFLPLDVVGSQPVRLQQGLWRISFRRSRIWCIFNWNLTSGGNNF